MAKLLVTNPAALNQLAAALAKFHPASCSPCAACTKAPTPSDTNVVTGLNGEDVFVTLHVVKQMVGLGKTRIYELVREGRFPAPYKLGGTSTRWSLAEIGAWRRELKQTHQALRN